MEEKAQIILAGDRWQLVGAVTFSTVNDLLAQSRKRWRDLSSVTIDFDQTTHVDSAALALLLEWKRWFKETERTIKFLKFPDQLVRLIEISSLTAVL